jgi:cardiolipin synthase
MRPPHPPASGVRAGLLLLCGLLLPACFTGCTNFYGKGIQYQIEHRYSISDAEFLRSMGSLVEPGILPSNRVTTLINGEQIFPAMLSAVQAARKSICLETYIYWSGEVGRQFSEALAERASTGVKVHVIIDWIGSRRIDSALLDRMRDAGVEVERYNPLVWYAPTRLNHRDHRKVLIVDSKLASSAAPAGRSLAGNADSPDHWRDSMPNSKARPSPRCRPRSWTTGEDQCRVLDGDDYFPELTPAGNQPQVFKVRPAKARMSASCICSPSRRPGRAFA